MQIFLQNMPILHGGQQANSILHELIHVVHCGFIDKESNKLHTVTLNAIFMLIINNVNNQLHVHVNVSNFQKTGP